MPANIRNFSRRAIWALPVWALLLFLSTLTHQPDPQTDFASFANYVTTDIFLFSHLVNSILGAAVGSVGAVALALFLQDTPAAGKAITGMAALVTANTLLSSVFGAAAYAQRGIGQAHLAGEQNALEIYNLIYGAPLFITALVGMLLFIASGVFIGLAIAASGRFPRWTSWVVPLGMFGFVLGNLFIPLVGNIMVALLFAALLFVALTASRRGAELADSAAVYPAK